MAFPWRNSSRLVPPHLFGNARKLKIVNVANCQPPPPLTVQRMTAPGRGAVAVLRVSASSPAAAALLQPHFESAGGRDPTTAKVGSILYGHWGAEDVVLTRCGELTWEICCHGGDAAVSKIAADLGGEARRESESPSVEATLLEKLLKCRTLRTAKFMLAQQQNVLKEFLDILSSYKDFDTARPAFEQFLSWQAFADHLTEPWKVAVIGRPNAGKSSLLNAIVGYERSIVFEQPGTTRDRVEAEVILDGWPFQFIDTAGVRDNVGDEIEAVGVAAARASIADSDACLLVVDSSQGWTADDAKLAAAIPPGCVRSIVWNKTDIAVDREPPYGVAHVLQTSVVTGVGLDGLLAWLPALLIPHVPDLDEPLPVIDTFTEAVKRALKSESVAEFHHAVRADLNLSSNGSARRLP